MNKQPMGQGKSGTKVSDDTEDLSRVPLQAILLADSFSQKFYPITLERPKVLLPLVNVHMIDYTLGWLEEAEVKEVFVFCCEHSKQVIDYLEKSHWFLQPNFLVSIIESRNSSSAGDALRLIYERHLIHGDFVLISGDTVSNMSLTHALHEHKARREKDSDAVMTMIITHSKPSPITHQSRLGTDELFMAINPQTKQLLYYEDKTHIKGSLSINKMSLPDVALISNDKQDCYIDICSPEVLALFTDNFDYQHLRRHFVKGLLVDDIMGYKIFTYELQSSYAAQIHNFRSYDTVSKDIIQRWTYPFVPDIHFFGNSPFKAERNAIYRASDIEQSRSAKIGSSTVIGSGTHIGNNTTILNSVVGEGCTIGSNVLIEGSYIWKNVTIEDGCKLSYAIICDDVIMRSGSILEPGVVLSFKVVIGLQFVVPTYSMVSLLQPSTQQDSDQELECADHDSGNNDCSSDEDVCSNFSDSQYLTMYEVGAGGRGFIWPVRGREENWRHSVAPIPAYKIDEMKAMSDDDEVDVLTHDSILLTSPGELKVDTDSNYSEDNSNELKDITLDFENEVEATFLRAVHENIFEDHLILEVNSLRLSYNMTPVDCAGAIFSSVLKLVLETPPASSELLKKMVNVISRWQKLLKHYIPSIDEEIEVILKFEEMCEGFKEFAPLFAQALHVLYDKEILEEEAILRWAHEKEGADESDKVFLNQSQTFIRWLKEASEEEDDDDDDDDDDEDN